MKGEWKVSVRNRRSTYTFTLRRNITALTGNSGNYFLLITREYLHQLPYNVTEIYQIVGSKNKRFESVYSDIYRMYDHPRC